MSTRRITDVSESAFQAEVLELARMLRWRRAHFRAARTAHGWATPVQGDGKGFPDLVLVRDHRLIFTELKSDTGRLTPEQQVWLDDLAHVTTTEAHLWRPGDLQGIAHILR